MDGLSQVKGEGVHYFCLAVEYSLEEAEKWKRNGMEILHSDKEEGYAYIDANDLVGINFEFFPKRELTLKKESDVRHLVDIE